VRQDAVGEVGAYGEAYLLAAAVSAAGVVCALFVRSSARGVVEAEAPTGAPAPTGVAVPTPELTRPR
jgi:hypothetical protein